jgi:hypothetical protein
LAVLFPEVQPDKA